MTWITADFPALPKATKDKLTAFTTTRMKGSSCGQYNSLNLATHVGDDLDVVYANRALLRETTHLPSEPYWLNQTHSNISVELPYEYRGYTDGNIIAIIEADASFTSMPEHICAVMTADCLPVLLVDEGGNCVASIHAGWRGLANGVIENTIKRLNVSPEKIHAWLGPAIGPNHFEVGQDVKDTFVASDSEHASCFIPRNTPGKYLCDIYELARQQMQRLGVEHISGGEFCTVTDQERFFSYRRDGQTGRMASLIWLKK